jgi:transcription-repair coupling factor (superfamily II helicase)
MAAHFPDEKKQHYYQSEVFSKILNFVQQNPQRCKFKQTPNNLVIGIQHIAGIAHAKAILNELYNTVFFK